MPFMAPDLRGGKQCSRLITTRRVPVLSETRAQKNHYALPDTYAWRWLSWHLVQAGEQSRLRSLLSDGHSAAILCVAMSADGTRAVSGSEDRTVRVWELPAGRGRQLHTGHSHQLRAVAWTPDGTRVVFSPGDETVVVLDLAEKEVVATCRGHESLVRAIAVSPDGRHILTGSADRTVRSGDRPGLAAADHGRSR